MIEIIDELLNPMLCLNYHEYFNRSVVVNIVSLDLTFLFFLSCIFATTVVVPFTALFKKTKIKKIEKKRKMKEIRKI